MMNNDSIGVLEYNNKEYPFILDGRNVKIIGEPFQFIKDFDSVEEVEIINGVTTGNRDIRFLKCKFNKLFPWSAPSFTIQGYAISCSNTGVPCDFTYDKISFESDAINTFYSPQKAIEVDLDMDNWEGEIDIKVSPFRNTTKEFEHLESICELSISRHVRINEEPTSIGCVKSLFAFKYSHTQQLLKVLDDYLALYDFLSFVNYSSNIPFKSINISKKNKDCRFEKTANIFIYSNNSSYENASRHSITYEDIPSEKLSAIFTRIASLRKNDSRLRYYFPENERDGRYIDPGKWLIMALNFEGLFSTVFPDYKCNTNEAFNKAKKLVLERIDHPQDSKSLSNKENDYYQKCREQIEHFEGQLEEKFNYILKTNKTILNNILKYNQGKLGIQVTENYGSLYANYRNKIAHGFVVPLTDKEIAVYRVLLPMIYILLLSEVELSDAEKQKIINKLFE